MASDKPYNEPNGDHSNHLKWKAIEYAPFLLTLLLLVVAMWFFWIFLKIQLYYSFGIVGALTVAVISGLSFLYNSNANLYVTVEENNSGSCNWIVFLRNAGPGVAVNIELQLHFPQSVKEEPMRMKALGPQEKTAVDCRNDIPEGSKAEMKFNCGITGLRKRHYEYRIDKKDAIISTTLLT